MARPKKCICCSKSIIGEQGIPYKNHYAHEQCFNIAIKMLQKDKIEQVADAETKKRGKVAKPKAELKSNISEEEYKDKQNYYSYIRKIIGTDELNVKVYALSEDFIKRYKFTFSSMYQTLFYLHEIIGKELTGDIVGIIPYYHSETQQYYKSIIKTTELNENIDTTSMYQQKTINIKPRKNKIKQLDFKSV